MLPLYIETPSYGFNRELVFLIGLDVFSCQSRFMNGFYCNATILRKMEMYIATKETEGPVDDLFTTIAP